MAGNLQVIWYSHGLTCWDTAVSALPSPASPPFSFAQHPATGNTLLNSIIHQPEVNPEFSWFRPLFAKKHDALSRPSHHVSTVWQTPMFLLKPASNDLESSNVFLPEGILNIITFPTVCSALKKKQQLCMNTPDPRSLTWNLNLCPWNRRCSLRKLPFSGSMSFFWK